MIFRHEDSDVEASSTATRTRLNPTPASTLVRPVTAWR